MWNRCTHVVIFFVYCNLTQSLINLAMFFQVPRSSKKLYEDNEYALYTVTLFGRVADNFRTAARERCFQVSILFKLHMLPEVLIRSRDVTVVNLPHAI